MMLYIFVYTCLKYEVMIFSRIILLGLICTNSLLSFAQISTGKVENKKENKENTVKRKTKKSYSGLNKEYIGFVIGRSIAESTVKSNDFPYGFPLGLRANEKSHNAVAVSLSYSNYLKKYVGIKTGLNFFKMGEDFNFKSDFNDSTLNYSRTYSYIGVPLNGMFTYGNKLKVNAFGGLTPMFLVSSVYTENSKTNIGLASEKELKTIQGYRVLNLGLNVGAELVYNINDNCALSLSSNYVSNFLSTYTKTGPYIHKSSMIQYNVGIHFAL